MRLVGDVVSIMLTVFIFLGLFPTTYLVCVNLGVNLSCAFFFFVISALL